VSLVHSEVCTKDKYTYLLRVKNAPTKFSRVQPIAFGVSLNLSSNLNFLGLFSTERGKRDLEN